MAPAPLLPRSTARGNVDTTVAAISSVAARGRAGPPLCQTPVRSAVNSLPPIGSAMAPATTTPSMAAATETHQKAMPRAKFTVPSMGSTCQATRPEPVAPPSSPSTVLSGSSARIRPRMMCSAAMSCSVTRS